MIAVYLIIVLATVGLFIYTILPELKKDRGEAPSLKLQDFSAPTLSPGPEKPKDQKPAIQKKGRALFSFGKKAPPGDGAALLPDGLASVRPSSNVLETPVQRSEEKDRQEAVIKKLEEKCAKLEQLLAEKNHVLDIIQKDLGAERSHRSEFDSVKEILQRQIEDLKGQNKKLRDEFEQSLQKKPDLPAKDDAAMMEQRKETAPSVATSSAEIDYVRAEPDEQPPVAIPGISSAADEVIPANPSVKPEPNSLSLHDIFGDEGETKTQNP